MNYGFNFSCRSSPIKYFTTELSLRGRLKRLLIRKPSTSMYLSFKTFFFPFWNSFLSVNSENISYFSKTFLSLYISFLSVFENLNFSPCPKNSELGQETKNIGSWWFYIQCRKIVCTFFALFTSCHITIVRLWFSHIITCLSTH